MNKQIGIVIILLFSLILINQAGNTPSPSGAANKNTAKSTVHAQLPTSVPEEQGMSTEILSRIDSIAKNSIKENIFPGCQIFISKNGKTVYDKCFGKYTYEGTQKVEPTTLYDLASLSKTTGTLLAIMKLYDTGKLKLTDKASNYLTFLRGTNKENITIAELLLHESGLPAGLPFHQLALEKKNTPTFLAAIRDTMHFVRLNSKTQKYKDDWASKIPSAEFQLHVSDSFYLHTKFHEAAMQMIAHTRLSSKTYVYSCVNFILLKEIVETISGSNMDVFLENEFYRPLGLTDMVYLPLRTHKKEDIAPTLKKDFLRNGLLQGYVHDPDAAFLGGVSGNAGLFSNAHTVAIVYQMILNGGELEGKRYLSTETCKTFTTTSSVSGRRYLGYDKPVTDNPRQSPCCISAPDGVYGHTGYTGTCCWVDPVNEIVYVFLSNRTYPNDGVNKLAKMSIRPRIQEVIYKSLKTN